MSQVELRTLTKTYPGGVTAIEDISIAIREGEFMTLVGPSGCGKTTTLRTIAGFEQPTSGSVILGGNDISADPPDSRNTGTVFQNFALFPHLTVQENVEYGLTVQDVDESERTERVHELLDLVDLSGMGDRVPEQLSGGQQQRVALARALAPEPDVLLLDEPLSSLDKKLRESMQVELRRIHRELDITTLLVTHNQREALTMSDRIAVMRDGHIEQIGTPQEVYQSPRSRFVADFIGTANLLNGTVTHSGEQPVFTDEQGFSLTLADGAVPTVDGNRSDATAVVRPEDVSVHPQNGTDAETCDMMGTIGFSRYLGSEFEYHVDSGQHDKTIVATESIAGHDLSEGDDVHVDIDSENIAVVVD